MDAGSCVLKAGAWPGPGERYVEDDMQHATEAWLVLLGEGAMDKEGPAKVGACLQKFVSQVKTRAGP